MKKMFFLLSVLFITAWAASFFIGHLTGAVHMLAPLSVIFYLRSLMVVEMPENNGTELGRSRN